MTLLQYYMLRILPQTDVGQKKNVNDGFLLPAKEMK